MNALNRLREWAARRSLRWHAKVQLCRQGPRLLAFPVPAFNSFLVRKRAGALQFLNIQEYETRNASTMSLITLADQQFDLADFDWLLVNTDDVDVGPVYAGWRCLSYCTRTNDFSHACPDFVFDHWKQTQLHDYELARARLALRAHQPPQTNCLGWRGADTHPNRKRLVQAARGDSYDVRFINWEQMSDGQLRAIGFMSLDEQQQKWRYLIDIQGRGYSGRLKLLLSMGRVVFMQERQYQEWYAEHLRPWVHYVPVKSDFSDLDAHLRTLQAHPELEQAIIAQASSFARQHLTRARAVERWGQLLSRT